jgi:hypothetical protein
MLHCPPLAHGTAPCSARTLIGLPVSDTLDDGPLRNADGESFVDYKHKTLALIFKVAD